MAEVAQVRAAVTELARGLNEDVDEEIRRKIPERSVSLVLHDLGVAFHGRLVGGRLDEVVEAEAGDEPDTDARLVMSSDELLALVDGSSSFAGGWASGRIRVHAGLRTLLELRRFL